MPVPKLSNERCERRNRIAARRDGVNAVPFRFNRDGAERTGGGSDGRPEPFMSPENALRLINEGAGEPLTLEQIYIHYPEAANSNFVGDRFCFLHSSTLRNIAEDADHGFAFMNSHRTGSLSHQSELPYGRTFCGQYEEAGDYRRAVVGLYMLRGQKPNGDSGPSTDDLDAGIRAGTIFDVSVRLHGGEAICDVCGNDVSDYEACDHYPGTTSHMSEDEMALQEARGVPGGCASYTIVDAHCGEVSAVYDGAVPGAGFRKTLKGLQRGAFDKASVAQARAAYGKFLSEGETIDMDEKNILDTIRAGFAELGSTLKAQFTSQPPAPHTPPPPAPPAPATAPVVDTALQARFDAQAAQLAAQAAVIANMQASLEAEKKSAQTEKNLARVEAAVKLYKILPAARPQFESLAKEHPAAFELAMAGIDANGAVVALTGGGRLGADADSPDSTLAAAETQEGNALENFAKEIQEKGGREPNGDFRRSYQDCFKEACKQHKDLAAAHFAGATGN